MQSKVRIVAEHGRLREVTVNGARIMVALDGLELRLEDGKCPVLRLTIPVLDLMVEGDLQALIVNAQPGDCWVSTSQGAALARRAMRNGSAQLPNETSSNAAERHGAGEMRESPSALEPARDATRPNDDHE